LRLRRLRWVLGLLAYLRWVLGLLAYLHHLCRFEHPKLLLANVTGVSTTKGLQRISSVHAFMCR
jgi:hypothetical protein